MRKMRSFMKGIEYKQMDKYEELKNDPEYIHETQVYDAMRRINIKSDKLFKYLEFDPRYQNGARNMQGLEAQGGDKCFDPSSGVRIQIGERIKQGENYNRS